MRCKTQSVCLVADWSAVCSNTSSLLLHLSSVSRFILLFLSPFISVSSSLFLPSHLHSAPIFVSPSFSFCLSPPLFLFQGFTLLLTSTITSHFLSNIHWWTRSRRFLALIPSRGLIKGRPAQCHITIEIHKDETHYCRRRDDCSLFKMGGGRKRFEFVLVLLLRHNKPCVHDTNEARL